MASPQTENGYTKIANELLDAVICFPFTRREYKIVLAVIRMTYGYNKTSDFITNWRLHKMTGISNQHVSNTLKSLHERKVLTINKTLRVIRGQEVREIGLNKNYSQWFDPQRNSTLNKTFPQQVIEGDPNQTIEGDPQRTVVHIKERKKEKKVSEKIEYPEWLDLKAWTDWKQHRKEIRKPMTPLAEQKGIKKLKEMANGITQRQIIDHCIANGYQGLFPPDRSKRAPESRAPLPEFPNA